MLLFILRRVGMMIPTLAVISVVSFFIIQLPPGDFLSSYVAQLSMEGDYVDQDIIDALERRYGMGQPVYVQYWKWVSGIVLRGDWGQSFEWEKPVKDLIWERIGLTMVLSSSTMLFSWLVSIPIGVYSATHQYSILDYLLSFFAFVGRGQHPQFHSFVEELGRSVGEQGVGPAGMVAADLVFGRLARGRPEVDRVGLVEEVSAVDPLPVLPAPVLRDDQRG